MVLPNRGENHGLLALDLQYGLLLRIQISVGTVLSSSPSETRDPSSGDLNIAARVSLSDESPYATLLTAQLGVNAGS
jgi:hypothetical protein